MCGRCNLQFFERRYSPSEIEFLYHDYRGDEYLRRRKRWEPWYSNKRNESLGHDDEVTLKRKLAVEGFLSRFLDSSTRLRIVDYGGDEGQFIPTLPNIDFSGVFEVSGRPVRSGVKTLTSLEQVCSVSPNLIMLCHVLEHFTDPRAELQRIVGLIDVGSHLYVEVPLDGHQVKAATPTWLVALFRSCRVLFIVSDFISQICRYPLGWNSRFRLIKQSEHLQFFSLSTLEVLAVKLGLSVIGSFRYTPDSSMGSPETLGVLLKKQCL